MCNDYYFNSPNVYIVYTIQANRMNNYKNKIKVI